MSFRRFEYLIVSLYVWVLKYSLKKKMEKTKNEKNI